MRAQRRLFALFASQLMLASPSFAQATRTAQRANPSRPAQSAPKPKQEIVGTLSPAAAAALGDPWHNGNVQSRPKHALGTGKIINGIVPVRVIDAPLVFRGGGAIVLPSNSIAGSNSVEPAWYPTMTPPKWRVVADEHPVQGWRVVDVDDVVCNAAGNCTTLTTRMLARWAPRLRSYAFADRVGRIWVVE